LANTFYLLACGRDILKSNSSVSLLFLFYAAFNLIGTILGPATIIIFVVGGLSAAFSWEGPGPYILGIGLPLFYIFFCVVFFVDMPNEVIIKDVQNTKLTKTKLQVRMAELLTAVYACLITAIWAVILVQLVNDIRQNLNASINSRLDTQIIGNQSSLYALQASIPTQKSCSDATTKLTCHDQLLYICAQGNLYKPCVWRTESDGGYCDCPNHSLRADSIFLLTLTLIFLVTAIIHGEILVLLCGFVYLFLIPTMYLLLVIYSIANMHDQGWGTREKKR